MLNRTLCGVLEEMRMMHKTRNYSGLRGLVEEAQSMGNRMEAALDDQKDIKSLHSRKKTLERQLKELKIDLNILKDFAQDSDFNEIVEKIDKVTSLRRYEW